MLSFVYLLRVLWCMRMKIFLSVFLFVTSLTICFGFRGVVGYFGFVVYSFNYLIGKFKVLIFSFAELQLGLFSLFVVNLCFLGCI